MGKIVKWLVIGFVALAVIGFVAGNDDVQRGMERGADEVLSTPTPEATPEPTPEPTVVPISDEEIDQIAFELAIDMTIQDNLSDICEGVEVLGMEAALDAMHGGYGDGYWDRDYVESAINEAC